MLSHACGLVDFITAFCLLSSAPSSCSYQARATPRPQATGHRRTSHSSQVRTIGPSVRSPIWALHHMHLGYHLTLGTKALCRATTAENKCFKCIPHLSCVISLPRRQVPAHARAKEIQT
jgi:hypothetical protein